MLVVSTSAVLACSRCHPILTRCRNRASARQCSSDLGIALTLQRLSGGYSGGVPPLPIPNREVKPVIADGTAMQCGRVGSRLLSLWRGFPNGKSLLFLSIFALCFSSLFPLLYSLFLHSRNCSKSIKNIKSAIFLLDYFCKYLIFCNFAHEKVKNRIL